MTPTANALRLFSLLVVFLLGLSLPSAQAQRRSKSKSKSAQPRAAATEEASELTDGQVRLKLTDRTLLPVEDAWESPQGIWYKLSGITHLVSRDRVKGIERGQANQTKPEPQSVDVKDVKDVTDVSPATATSTDQPVWIYLKGGARVEVDSATESVAGVWYTRGPLSIFIDRARVDHIEREPLASLANSKKERGWSTGRPKIDALIRQNGAKYGVDPYLVFCVMEQESHFNARVVSPKGARGLMQLMPGTGARFGVRRPFDPAQNIAGGTRYLKELLRRFNGRVDLVLASYNAGEGAVVRFGHRVPPYRETRNYVKRVGYRYRRAKSPVSPRPGNGTPVGGN